jgi:hypothetical protein
MDISVTPVAKIAFEVGPTTRSNEHWQFLVA